MVKAGRTAEQQQQRRRRRRRRAEEDGRSWGLAGWQRPRPRERADRHRTGQELAYTYREKKEPRARVLQQFLPIPCSEWHF